jgi:hypothetical protein
MDLPAAELPPGCLVLLIRLSADMAAEAVTGRGELPAWVAARFLADELLEGLVNTLAAGYAVGELDVAVLGYRTSEDGSPQLFSLWPDGELTPRFVPLATVAEMPAEPRAAEGQPRKWTVLPPSEGEPCAAAALGKVYQMVAVWLTGRYASRPPGVVHCTGTDGLDDAYFRVARSLGLRATGHGPARLLHYAFDATNDEVRHLRLLEVSSEVPENAEAGRPARRGLFLNDWDIGDPWDALFTYSRREDGAAWAEAGAGLQLGKAMWTQKMGNSPDQWEDAFAVDEANGVAAIADGASTGIYCRTWAEQLSRRLLADRPDARDPASLNKWVSGLRREWRDAINYDNLNWSKQAKVDQVGAAATLLSLELGPPDEGGSRPWRACAVGDACLFWLRGGRLLASFPVVAADQFGSAPLLVRSNPGYKTLALHAAGECEPGDRFVLATDAVASRLLKSAATGPGPDWERFEHITEDEWRAELDSLRSANDMVNDDCTLVVLQVRGQGSGVRSQEAEAHEQEPEGSAREAASPLTPDPCPLVPDGDASSPSDEGPPPEAEPPAARDGFPESTDTRD